MNSILSNPPAGVDLSTAYITGVLSETHGGTNQSTYTKGDLLYASDTNLLSKLADIATGNVLLSGGVGAIPSYGKVGLTTHVSGILGSANGGTGNGFAKFTGPTTAEKTFTLPDASATLATTTTRIGVNYGGNPEIVVGEAGYLTLADAVTAIGATPATLVVKDTQVGGGVVIPSTCTLKPIHGAANITVANLTTFAVNGPVIDPGNVQWITLTGTGAVSGLSKAKPQWFGSTTAAMTAALAASNVVEIPEGTTVPCVNVAVASNKKILGAGTIQTPANSALNANILNLGSSTNVQITGITLDGNKANQINTGQGLIYGLACSDIIIDVPVAKDNYFPSGPPSSDLGAIHIENGARCSVKVGQLLRWEREGIHLKNCTESKVYDTFAHGCADPAGENNDNSYSSFQISGSRNSANNLISYYSGNSGVSFDSADGVLANSIVYKNKYYSGFNFGHTYAYKHPNGAQGVNLTSIDAGWVGGVGVGSSFSVSYNTLNPVHLSNIRGINPTGSGLEVSQGSAGVVVNGVEITGADLSGVTLNAVENFILNGGSITSCTLDGVRSVTTGCNYIKISNSKISSNTSVGVNIGGTVKVVQVENAEIESNGSHGISIGSLAVTGTTFTDLLLNNSRVNSNVGSGVKTYKGKISNSIINSNGAFGIYNYNIGPDIDLVNTEVLGNTSGAVQYADFIATRLPQGNRIASLAAAPTGGTWKQGDQWFNNAAASGQPSGGVCTAHGTFENAGALAATTTSGSPVVAMASTTGLYVGMYVDFTAGFADLTGRKILAAVQNTSITVDANANATGAANVSTVNPTFAAMANLP